jgi:hypothetical protein
MVPDGEPVTTLATPESLSHAELSAPEARHWTRRQDGTQPIMDQLLAERGGTL